MKKKATKRAAAKRPARVTTKVRRPVKRAIKPAPAFTALRVPALGAIWPGQGGRFAGICKGATGQPDHLLIVADLDKSTTQADAIAAAKAYTADRRKDFDAATLAEAAQAYATCKEHFKREWYWTGEQPAGVPGSGWIQSFDDGGQYWVHAGFRNRVFAVRRLPIR